MEDLISLALYLSLASGTFALMGMFGKRQLLFLGASFLLVGIHIGIAGIAVGLSSALFLWGVMLSIAGIITLSATGLLPCEQDIEAEASTPDGEGERPAPISVAEPTAKKATMPVVTQEGLSRFELWILPVVGILLLWLGRQHWNISQEGGAAFVRGVYITGPDVVVMAFVELLGGAVFLLGSVVLLIREYRRTAARAKGAW